MNGKGGGSWKNGEERSESVETSRETRVESPTNEVFKRDWTDTTGPGEGTGNIRGPIVETETKD